MKCALARCFALWVSLVLLPASAWAASYQFPGNLPSGCSSTGATTFTCGALNLANADTVTIVNKPATITFTSTLTTNGAGINPTGAAADVTMNIAGALSTASGAVVVANVKAGSISDAGGARFTGNLVATSGTITLSSGSTLTGNATASVGVTVNSGVIAGSVTAQGGDVNLYSTELRGNATASGAVYDNRGVITGTVTAQGGDAYLFMTNLTGNATASGGVTVNTGVVTGSVTSQGGDAYLLLTNLTGNATASGGVTVNTSVVSGSVTAGGEVALYFDSRVGGNVQSSATVSVWSRVTVSGTTTGAIVNAGFSDSCYFGASVVATAGWVAIGPSSTVNGAVIGGGENVYVLSGSTINGDVLAASWVQIWPGVKIAGTTTGQVVDASGGDSVTYGGNVTATNGWVNLSHDSNVNGNIVAYGGDITLGASTSVSGSVSSSNNIAINGWYVSIGSDVSATSLSASDGYFATYGGNISTTTGGMFVGDASSVAGNVTSTTGGINLQGGARVSGNATCQCTLSTQSSAVVGTTQVDTLSDAGASDFRSTVQARYAANLGVGSEVLGDLISMENNATEGNYSNITGCMRSRAGSITINAGTGTGGVCCGTGSCTSSCVSNNSGHAMPDVCASAAPLPMAEYRFEQTTYTNKPKEVLDSSAFGNHGTTVGSVSSTASGKICRGLSIPQNTTSAIQALNTGIAVNTIGSTGSIAFWYKSVTSGTEHRNLFDASINSSGNFYLYRSGSGAGVALGFVLKGNCFTCGDSNVGKTAAMSDATWTHISVTWSFAASNTVLKMYVNGALVATQTNATADSGLSTSIGTLFFGDQSSSYAADSPNSANGSFDQIQIFNTALSATEVAAVYANAPGCQGVHHLEITTPSATVTDGVSTTFSIKACATADCSTAYTGGITGTVTLTGAGVTPTFTVGPDFTMASGTSTATVVASATPSGSVTVGVTSVNPLPTSITPLYCGLGEAASSGGSCVLNIAAALHHLAVTSVSATGMTCMPNTFTLTACGNAACSVLYTSGLTGNLSVAGTGLSVVFPSGAGFNMASGASSATVAAQVFTAGTATVGVSGLSVAPTGSPGTYCGMGTAATSGGSCAFTSALAGFLVAATNHVAETTSSVTVTAIRASDQATGVCLPAFTTAKTVTLKCSYANPATGSLPARVGGTALNTAGSASAACDGSGKALLLSFNASGVATATLAYADAGKLNLTANYVGSGSDAGLTMTGTGSFTTAPASFGFSAVTAAPIRAGSAFSATVSALNNAGALTPNFGSELIPEAATLTFTRRQPTGTGSQAGTFSGSLGAFSAGVASASTLAWTEVGSGDLTATLNSGNYLSSGLSVTGTTGTTGAVGRFIPHHFSLATAPACGSFSYAGQPFASTITALNAAGSRTYNYDGGGTLSPAFAKAVTLSDANALGKGSLSGASVAAASFATGVAVVNPSYTFTNKLTSTQTLTLRATDADGVTSLGYAEGSMELRSGRLVISNAFGSEKSPLSLPLRLQYWSGNSWVPTSDDTCTVIPAAAVARSNAVQSNGSVATWTSTVSALTLSGGMGSMTLTSPSGGGTGSMDVALNLGSTTADLSCLTSHPVSTGAGVPWLRARAGSCAATQDRDPSARATFGVFAPETRKTIHLRELF